MLQVQFINTIFIIVEAACPSVLRSTLSAKYKLRKTVRVKFLLPAVVVMHQLKRG